MPLRVTAAFFGWLLYLSFSVTAQAQTMADETAAPKLKAQLSEPRTIEIYEQYGTYTLDAPPPEMHPIVLSIPEQFLYGSSKQTSRSWGVNILTYYPSFSSPQDPANADFGVKCIGVCNGQILISVANRAHSISAEAPNMGDFIARAELRWLQFYSTLPNVHVASLDPKDVQFDRAFERLTTPPPGQKTVPVELVYMKKVSDGEHCDLTATCQKNEIKLSCILHFSLRCDPKIYVTINGLDGSYLDRVTDIKAKADQFVSAMVRNSSCAKQDN